MIGHSRGAIMLMQVCHRVAKFFPNRLIEHYTIDPHPATTMEDAHPDTDEISLPGVFGIPINCGISCEFVGSITLKLPFNIVKADNYFRQDGKYEGLDYGDFDGVSNVSVFNFNRKLKNALIIDNGIAHSYIHRWYLGTIDTLSTEYSGLGGKKQIPASCRTGETIIRASNQLTNYIA